MLKVYVNPLSAPSNKVLFGLHALDLEYERVQIDLAKGEQMQDAFKALNPFGKVPVIDDDGFVLYESGAIVAYLARRAKSPMYPSTYKARALVDQWCHFAAEVLQIPLQRVFFNRVIAPMIGAPIDDTGVSQGMRQLDAYLPVLDSHLKSSGNIYGDELTLADLTLVSVLDPAKVAQIDITPYDALAQWWERMRAEEFYTRTHTHFGAGILDRT